MNQNYFIYVRSNASLKGTIFLRYFQPFMVAATTTGGVGALMFIQIFVQSIFDHGRVQIEEKRFVYDVSVSVCALSVCT